MRTFLWICLTRWCAQRRNTSVSPARLLCTNAQAFRHYAAQERLADHTDNFVRLFQDRRGNFPSLGRAVGQDAVNLGCVGH